MVGRVRGVVVRNGSLVLALVVVGAVVLCVGCADSGGGVVSGNSGLVDVGGGSGWTPTPGRDAGSAGPDVVTPDDTWKPPADVPVPEDVPAPDDIYIEPPPDVYNSLAPSCPAPEGIWRAYFNKTVDPSVAPEVPAACGGVELERTLAWWISRAQERIELSIYSVDAQVLADELINAHWRGVPVRVIVDYTNRAGEDGSRIGDLIDEGIDVKVDPPSRDLMHHKFAIIDDQWVVMGSTNGTFYDGRNNANSTLVFDSEPLAGIFQGEMDLLWGGGFQSNKGGRQTLQLDGGYAEVHFSPSRYIEGDIATLIERADHEVFVAMFAFTNDDIADALIDRCGEIDMIVMMDREFAEGHSDQIVRFTRCSSIRVVYDEVEQAEGMTFDAALHHKYALIDALHPNGDPVLIVGSMNWSGAGVDDNDEATLIWHHAGAVRTYLQEFAARLREAGGQLP